MVLKEILFKYKKLIENFFSLSLLNVTNYIFPLLVIPYLTRVLGVEKYGVYVFAYSVLSYFNLVIQYGFLYSGTKKVSVIRDDKAALNLVFSSITLVRVAFNLIGCGLLLLLLLFVPMLRGETKMYLLGIGVFVGQSMTPYWLLQGLENMRYITIVNFVSRLASVFLIFLFVKEQSDYSLAMGIQSISFIIGAIFSYFIVFFHLKISFVLPSLKEMIVEIKDGFQIFLSTIGINFYRDSNILILGLLTNYTIVGYYAPAEKLIKAVQSVTTPFVNTLYPYFSRRLNQERDNAKTFFKIGRYYNMVLLLLSLIVLLFAKQIIELIVGANFSRSVVDLRIFSFVILFGGMNFYYGIIGMVNFGLSHMFTRYVWISGIISVLFCFMLSYKYYDIGASVSMLLAEMLLFILIFKTLFEKNKKDTFKEIKIADTQ